MASVRQRDPKDPKSPWVVEYTNPNTGKRVRATPKSGLKRDADEMRRKIEREIETGTHMQVSLSPTIAEVTAAYVRGLHKRVLADEMLPSTYRNFTAVVKLYIDPYLCNLRVAELTVPKLQNWIDQLGADGNSADVVVKTKLCLNLALTEACRLGMIGYNPVAQAQLRMPRLRHKQIEIPTKDELRRIIACAHEDFRLIVSLAALTGLRVGELLGLRWDDVNFEKGLIHVRQQAVEASPFDRKQFGIRRLKTDASRRDVAMEGLVQQALTHWRTVCKPSHLNLVFATRYGGPIAHSNLRKCRWLPTLRKAGLCTQEGKPLYHFHALRHVYASLMIEQGVPPKELQASMGHTSITMTYDRYGHLFEQHAKTRSALGDIESELLLLPAA